jgi:hypothetical protein
MQYTDGRGWRDVVQKELEKLNIVVYNPYHQPFIKDLDEDESVRATLKAQMERGEFDMAASVMKASRAFDLNLVDRSDFIVAHIVPNVASWGSAEEITTAVRMKKPIFLSVEGGKKLCPLWILGMIPHKYVYNSIEDILSILRKIDDGTESLNNDRWRLLRKELR